MGATVPAPNSFEDWKQAKLWRDMYARLAALSVLDNRITEAKKYARSMLVSENVMNRTAAVLDQYPHAADE